jgi:toxin-antitoxin system PIN domain toxin
VIIVDANVLLYAYDASDPRHDRSRIWLESVLNGAEEIRLGLATILAFLRIGTDPRVYEQPLSPTDALGILRSWLERPNVALATPTDRHWPILAEVASAGKARGPLLMDAHVAALAIEYGARLASTDRDFTRFPRLKLFDPLTD